MGLLELAVVIIGQTTTYAINGLGNSPFAPSIDLNLYSLSKKQTEEYQDAKCDWPPPNYEGVGETRVPDVISTLHSTSDEKQKYIIIGEVKSSMDMPDECQASFHQTWRQSLLGLTHSDHTSGLLLHLQGAQLFHLNVRQETGNGKPHLRLATVLEEFEFKNKKIPSKPVTFNVDALADLLKRVIAIFLEEQFDELS